MFAQLFTQFSNSGANIAIYFRLHCIDTHVHSLRAAGGSRRRGKIWRWKRMLFFDRDLCDDSRHKRTSLAFAWDKMCYTRTRSRQMFNCQIETCCFAAAFVFTIKRLISKFIHSPFMQIFMQILNANFLANMLHIYR